MVVCNQIFETRQKLKNTSFNVNAEWTGLLLMMMMMLIPRKGLVQWLWQINIQGLL